MKLLVTLFLCFILSTDSSACDCAYGGPFLKMASDTKFVALVALIKVTKYLSFNDYKTPISMEVEIIDRY